MDCYNFSFQKSYTGFWKIDKNQKTKVLGTLILHDHYIEIEFYYDDHSFSCSSSIPSIEGEAFATNENGKKVLYKFSLVGLDFKTSTNFVQRMKHYVYDVKQFFVYTEAYDLKEIKSVCLRTHHLDRWASELVRQGFNIKDPDSKTGHFELEFAPHDVISLYHDDTSGFDVNIFFSWQYQINESNTYLKTKNFLNIEFGKQTLNISDAYVEIDKIVKLLYLLWNFSFQPEFLEFKTTKGDFILKISDKHSYQYIDTSASISPYTDIEDFSISDFITIVSKWYELYSDYSNALDTYFETISNDHTSPSVKIKNYVSTIDALSEGTRGPMKPIPDNTRNGKFLKKLEGRLNTSEMKRLRDLVLKEKPSQLKPRFRQLIAKLANVLPSTINEEFVTKIVNTRNNITHPKDKEEDSFAPDEYEDAAYLLTKVIRAHLLRYITISNTIIKKIIQF